MINIIRIRQFGFICLLFSTCSCTKVIDIDLNSSDPQIVIEGIVATGGNLTLIKLTESVNFSERNDFSNIENAIVELSDNFGNSEVLSEISSGLYSSSTITGIEGRTYYLSVITEEKVLTSSTTIPNQVSFDTLIITENNGGFGSSYQITVSYTDTASISNYYRFVEKVNGEIIDSYIFDDLLVDGQNIEHNLMNFERNLKMGDTVQVEMQCIDKSVYDYYNSFFDKRGGSSVPANPVTNIQGAILGIFSAHTTEVKQTIIP